MDVNRFSRSREEDASWRRDAGLLAPRAALAATMLYHGIDKLRDPTETKVAFGGLGFRPPGFWARLTAVAETAAGALALVGVLVRPAALAVVVTQAVAITKVHARRGFRVEKGGFEFNMALIAIAAALLLGGSGRYSASRLLPPPTRSRLAFARLSRRARRRRAWGRLLRLLG